MAHLLITLAAPYRLLRYRNVLLWILSRRHLNHVKLLQTVKCKVDKDEIGKINSTVTIASLYFTLYHQPFSVLQPHSFLFYNPQYDALL
jgi:hypothetical protein